MDLNVFDSDTFIITNAQNVVSLVSRSLFKKKVGLSLSNLTVNHL